MPDAAREPALKRHSIEDRTDTRPPIYFVHYWSKGPAEKLATRFNAVNGELGKGKGSETRP
jgi:hypothetical protein